MKAERDLGEVLAPQYFNHPDCFDSTHYARWERNIAEPALKEAGYEVLQWFSIDEDSFGPLVRGCLLRKDHLSEAFFYG